MGRTSGRKSEESLWIKSRAKRTQIEQRSNTIGHPSGYTNVPIFRSVRGRDIQKFGESGFRRACDPTDISGAQPAVDFP